MKQGKVMLITYFLSLPCAASNTLIIPENFQDPTKPLVAMPVIPSQNVAPQIFKGELKLSMIFCEKNACFAVINQDRYQTGDQILGLTILSISSDHLKLSGFQYTDKNPLILELAKSNRDGN